MEQKNKILKINLEQEENEVIRKAQEVEQQMLQVRQKKIQMLTDIYKEEVLISQNKEIDIFKQNLDNECIKKTNELSQKYNQKKSKILEFQKSIIQQIETFQMIVQELDEKLNQLELSFESAGQHIENTKILEIKSFQNQQRQMLFQQTQQFQQRMMNLNQQ